jgi:hypothetical protein
MEIEQTLLISLKNSEDNLMRKILSSLAVLIMIFTCQLAVQAQTTGSIGGTVVDQTGAVVPNATVVVRGQSGQEFTVTTSNNGTYQVPAVPAGFYTVTITGTGFKTSVRTNVKVDVGTPTTVDTALEVGDISQVVEVTTGGDVLQTQTPTVGTNIQGRAITETPIASRDALDLVTLLPGTNSVGAPRRSSINGLPKGAISITIDGVDVQDNSLRSSDGFFTYVRPRIDAIEEVTVSTANPGAESSGDGAVRIMFVTRRGTNRYSGGLYAQHRNEALNANYWYNNRDGLERQKIRLNQFGGRFGGRLPFFRFGEGGPWWHSGRDRSFFFVNYEEFRNPNSQSRTRTILTPDAAAGNFSYISGGTTQTVNLYNIAAANAQVATPDPTIAAIFARIQQATASTGTLTPITNNPNRRFYNFLNTGTDLRKFLALRLDFNLHKNHNLEFVWNRQAFKPGVDFLNARDPIFPGFPFYGQGGVRKSYTGALRSNFGRNIVNEFRYGQSGGTTDFFGTVSPDDFAFSQGFFLDFGAGSVTSPYNNNFAQQRATPTYDFTDNVTWIAGNHTINFGGQYKRIVTWQSNLNRVVPTVGFGVNAAEGTAFTMFNATTMPGSTAAQQAEARGLYALLTGRVLSYASNAYLNSAGQYVENASLEQEFQLNTYGLYAQDSWRIRPNLTINFGLRWQPQTAFTIQTANVGRLEHPDQVWGISGPGNLFRPGATGGQDPRVVLYQPGEKAYSDDLNNFAPSVGLVYSPNFKGTLSRIFGESGRGVFRAGYSRAFIREGSSLQTTITGNTPGGLLALSRNTGIAGSLTLGTLLRDPNNPNLVSPAFPATPVTPFPLTTANQALTVDPNLKTGYVDSYSFGYQRQLDRDSVIEFRYVGNRGYGVHRLNFINEVNTIENGFASEFLLAQQNFYANVAAGRGNTFAYFGPGTGTSPLPIMLAFFNTPANYDPLNPARYAAANFTNATLLTQLSRVAPSVLGFVGSTAFEADAARRANAIANGLPANFFRVNPAVPAGAFMLSSDARTWYDSGVIEYRRRMSRGLMVQANYVFSKAMSNAFASSGTQQSNYTLREGGLDLAKNYQVFDVRHNFKLNATYDLPFGRGRQFFSGASRAADTVFGGWSIAPVIRWQSGSPISFGNVQLVGMTKEELQKEIRVRKGPNVVTYLPDDIILNTQRAFNISVTSPTGYGTTFGGPPEGRFIAPSTHGNCIQRFAGECGFTNLILHGPSVFMFDMSISKRFRFTERSNFEIRATILDVLNQPAFRVGGWGADVIGVGVGGTTFGQLSAGSAYQDISTTNNPGGRIVDIILRFNF